MPSIKAVPDDPKWKQSCSLPYPQGVSEQECGDQVTEACARGHTTIDPLPASDESQRAALFVVTSGSDARACFSII